MKTKGIPVPENWKKLKHHRLACLIEFGASIDTDGLTGHMRRHGYDDTEPVFLFEGKILAGRHRHTSAIDAERTPTFREFSGTEDEARAFIEKELFRRHLTPSQKAMFAADLIKSAREANPAGVPDEIPTQSETAERFGIAERNVRDALTVAEHGSETLSQAVRNGTLAVSDAAKIVHEPTTVQEQAVKDVEAGKAPTVTKAAKAGWCDRCKRIGVQTPDCQACKEVKPKKGSKRAKANAEENGTAEEPEALADAEGHKVPEQAEEAFRADKEIRAWCRKVDELIREAGEFIKGPGGRLMSFETVKQQMQSAKGNVWANRPTHVCPYCQGADKKCKCCKGQGWTSKTIWQQAPKGK